MENKTIKWTEGVIPELMPNCGADILAFFEDLEIFEEGNIYLIKYKTIYGHRLHGGDLHRIEFTTDLDICCAASDIDYMWIRDKVKIIIAKNIAENAALDPFRGIPRYSRIKPYPHCVWFLSQIARLLEPFNP